MKRNGIVSTATVVVAAALTAHAASAHEDGDVESECLVLEQGHFWNIVNACDMTLDVSWCVEDAEDDCDWLDERLMRSGESVSTRRRSEVSISVRVVACRTDGEYGGMWGEPALADDSASCIVPRHGARLIAERAAQDSVSELEPPIGEQPPEARGESPQPPVARSGDDCIELLAERGYTYLKNSCDYTVAVSRCRAVGVEVAGAFACGGPYNPRYYSGFVHLNAGESEGGWEGPIHVAACRVGQDGLAFDPDGWDGKGGFACLDPSP